MPRKKIGSAGRFGPRYGAKIRKLVVEVERKLARRYRCPSCGAERVKRVSTSIWQCGRCDMKFAGAAYSPAAMAVKVGKRRGAGAEVREMRRGGGEAA